MTRLALPRSAAPDAKRLRRGYVAVNLLLVAVLYLWFLAPWLPFTVAGVTAHLILLASAAAILTQQYRLMMRTRSVVLQLLILYASELLFVAEVGAMQGVFRAIGSSPAGTLTAMLDGAFRFALLSHVVTCFLFPPMATLGLLIVRGDQKVASRMQ